MTLLAVDLWYEVNLRHCYGRSVWRYTPDCFINSWSCIKSPWNENDNWWKTLDLVSCMCDSRSRSTLHYLACAQFVWARERKQERARQSIDTWHCWHVVVTRELIHWLEGCGYKKFFQKEKGRGQAMRLKLQEAEAAAADESGRENKLKVVNKGNLQRGTIQAM